MEIEDKIKDLEAQVDSLRSKTDALQEREIHFLRMVGSFQQMLGSLLEFQKSQTETNRIFREAIDVLHKKALLDLKKESEGGIPEAGGLSS